MSPLNSESAVINRIQPSEVFSHRYGDCKDKATLLSTMLKEIGVESYYVLINTDARIGHGGNTAQPRL